MNARPVDLVGLVSAVMGISVLLVPVIGLTLRFALKPTAEALGRFFNRKEPGQDVNVLERRMALMEQQIQGLESSMHRLVEVTEFDRALRSGSECSQTAGPESQPL